ncbi:MAG: hypothetical protein OEV12_13405, partial [Gammaproteobacteria bacterium]|nr:hypothetical protein [Gammaproteobacteria bacterium]
YLVVQERIACAIDSATGYDRGQGPLLQVYLVVQERIACAIDSAIGYDRGHGPLLQVYLVVQERSACAIDSALGHDCGRGPLRQGYLPGYRGLSRMAHARTWNRFRSDDLFFRVFSCASVAN